MPVITEIKERLKELPQLRIPLHMAPVATFEIRDKRMGNSWVPLRFDGQDTLYCLATPSIGHGGLRYTTLSEICRVSAVNDLECYQLND